MSMLAERKRKQKWSLNPRGKDWALDANKFGQKMLEKMGWEPGKGLGAKEDGITEHVKVSYKNDSKGMGYKESNDQWTEHETNFTALLESLAGRVEKPDEIKLQSLEKKSESSRARVHYHKFTRGKDLSRYSEKDLANIFGKKSLKEWKTDEENSEPVGGNADKPEKESKFLVNAGSMKDYFKKKLAGFSKSDGYVVGSNGVLAKGDCDSDFRPSFSFNGIRDTEQHIGFGFESDVKGNEPNKMSFISYVNEANTGSDKKKKKKKRKVEECEDSTPKKKSKKDVGDKLKNDELGLSNPAFNPLCTPVKVEKHILTTIEETFSEDISAIEEYSAQTTARNGADDEENVSETGLERNRKKKKKKSVVGIDNSNFEESTYIENSHGDNSFIEESQKNGRMKKEEQPIFDGSSEDSTYVSIEMEENPYEVPTSVRKKKKKKGELCIENPSFNRSSEDFAYASMELEENPHEVQVSPKKKKKKAKLALENPCFNESEMDSIDLSSCENNAYEIKKKKEESKKKKEESKKKKKDAAAVENPCFNVSLEESTDVIQDEENPYEVKKKKKKKRKALALDDPACDGALDNLEAEENPYEIKRKKKKKDMAIENPCFTDARDSSRPERSSEVKEDLPAGVRGAFEVERKKKKSKRSDEETHTSTEDIALDVAGSDLMLNVVTTPIPTRPWTGHSEETAGIAKAKRRKSVRFSDVTQERIIPNNDELRSMADRNELFDINAQVLNRSLEEGGSRGDGGVDNMAFNRQRNRMEENVDSISRTLDRYQAEIENDMNEEKLETFAMEDIVVGEVGNPRGENERLCEGTRLKFKYAHFATTKTPFYHEDKVGPRKGYRHLIKGDIVVKFINTNLHQIGGYGVGSKSAVV